jgi:pyrroloquinoline quinone biosynthesis protein E
MHFALKGDILMGCTIKEYLKYMKTRDYDHLFDPQCLRDLENVEQVYGEVVASESIMEVVLSEEELGGDYSFCVKTEDDLVTEYWVELDAGSYGSKQIRPCYFIDASAVVAGKDNEKFYETALVRLVGEERVRSLLPMLRRLVEKLHGRGENLFQLGAMNGRGQDDRIRVFTNDMTKEQLLSFLEELSYPGSLSMVRHYLESWEPFSDKGLFILDFDILEDGISEKIGINFGTRKKDHKTIQAWLEFLVQNNLCLTSKKEDVLSWIDAFPQHTPWIQNDISHFKFAFQGNQLLKAKAYLRQSDHCMVQNYRAFDTPVIMNLELTTKCPFRCPQCYCSLEGGKDLEFNLALHWIQEAAKNKIQTVNLSGGETLIYPHLPELIRACKNAGMEANIAVSGYGITKEVLEELIACGTYDICISLNGSTREINDLSRQGYEEAIQALKLLRELQYEDVCINWVMQKSNADDFPAMIDLATQYDVKELVVMGYKPTARGSMEEAPTLEQIQKVVGQIRAYQKEKAGEKNTQEETRFLQIEIDPCYSLMKALVSKRFFTNLNTGIARGCGAGRDGISVNVDGKLTPCRHLEMPEEYDTIRSYWHNSQILHTLRKVEDQPEYPCADCTLQHNCLPCLAVNQVLEGRIFMGDSTCPYPATIHG